MKHRKTDYGTIILHWVLVAALSVAVLSGLRIASEAPERTWINAFDNVLPSVYVWTAHMQAAIVLLAVMFGYPTYLALSGLGRRVRLDKVRLRGLFSRGPARGGAVNTLLYWIFFITMLTLIGSGGLLYFGIFAGHLVLTAHWFAMWAVLSFVVLHVSTHFAVGGLSQLLRIFRPMNLTPPPPALDAVELMILLVEQSAQRQQAEAGTTDGLAVAQAQPAKRHDSPVGDPCAPGKPIARPPRTNVVRKAGSKRRSPILQSNPFVVAAAIAIAGASFIIAADRMSVDTLVIHRINKADDPILDGDTSDRAWRDIEPYSVMTNQGGNFDGKGETRVDIRAVHDGSWAYFLFTWQDPTRSLKQLPLLKEIDGWHLLHNGYEAGDEHDYNEDKFSVLLTTADVILAGDRTFHAGPHPIADEPATMTGRGLHYTNAGYADIWLWKATDGGPSGWMDDDHFGPPVDATAAQASHAVPYKGGFAPDPGAANYTENFVISPDRGDGNPNVTPRRLPIDLAATTAAMKSIDLDPNHGESDGARWFMMQSESMPYSPEQDRRIPVGTVLPGVILSGDFSGDRADVRCAARWASGHWALEVARRLDTHSPYDVALKSGVFMRVAAFDHSQIRHTRHVRPIRIEVE
jgi:hypothetical protein